MATEQLDGVAISSGRRRIAWGRIVAIIISVALWALIICVLRAA